MSGNNEFGFENPRSDFGLFFGEKYKSIKDKMLRDLARLKTW